MRKNICPISLGVSRIDLNKPDPLTLQPPQKSPSLHVLTSQRCFCNYSVWDHDCCTPGKSAMSAATCLILKIRVVTCCSVYLFVLFVFCCMNQNVAVLHIATI